MTKEKLVQCYCPKCKGTKHGRMYGFSYRSAKHQAKMLIERGKVKIRTTLGARVCGISERIAGSSTGAVGVSPREQADELHVDGENGADMDFDCADMDSDGADMVVENQSNDSSDGTPQSERKDRQGERVDGQTDDPYDAILEQESNDNNRYAGNTFAEVAYDSGNDSDADPLTDSQGDDFLNDLTTLAVHDSDSEGEDETQTKHTRTTNPFNVTDTEDLKAEFARRVLTDVFHHMSKYSCAHAEFEALVTMLTEYSKYKSEDVAMYIPRKFQTLYGWMKGTFPVKFDERELCIHEVEVDGVKTTHVSVHKTQCDCSPELKKENPDTHHKVQFARMTDWIRYTYYRKFACTGRPQCAPVSMDGRLLLNTRAHTHAHAHAYTNFQPLHHLFPH